MWRPTTVVDSAIEGRLNAYTDEVYIVAFKHHRGASTGEMIHAVVFRIDAQPIAGWSELQRIKNEVFGIDQWAYEVYPSEDCVVNTSNARHLWIRHKPFDFGYRFRADDINEPKLQQPATLVW